MGSLAVVLLIASCHYQCVARLTGVICMRKKYLMHIRTFLSDDILTRHKAWVVV